MTYLKNPSIIQLMLFDNETLFDILFHLPYEEALDKLLVCQDFYRLLSDPYFWKKKAKTDFKSWWDHKASSYDDEDGIDWKKIYDLREQLEPYSTKTLSRCIKANPSRLLLSWILYFRHAIDKDNYKCIRLYFTYGAKDMLNDNERLTILNYMTYPSKPRLYWIVTDHLRPSDNKLWQHAANYLLSSIILDFNSSFTIEDVFRLIDKSGELPHYFIYITLGHSQTPQLFYRFRERYKCEGDTFFKGIGNHKNTQLLMKYERDNGVLPPHFVKQMLLGAVENSHLSFIQYLRSRYPTIVTSEQLLYSCRIIISMPSLDIVKYALECSKVDIPVIETHEVALQKLIKANDIYLSGDRKIYFEKWLSDMENLAREWGCIYRKA